MDLKALYPVIAPLVVLQLILQVIAVVDLVRRESEQVRGPKVVWVVVVVLFGLLASVAYFLFGRKN